MSKASRNCAIAVGVVIGALWLVKYFSETEMRRLDKEVDRLCAIDGRSVIYEAQKLPASRFQPNGRAPIPPNDKDDVGFGYFVKGDSKTLAGPGQAPGARLIRRSYRVIRTSDSKVIAEETHYNRSGGNFLEGVPGVGEGRICPIYDPASFLQQVFIRE